jgi:hypothetical protein
MDVSINAITADILRDINSIKELDKDTIFELRSVLVGRFVVEKFEVTSSQWMEWLANIWDENGRGVEYDAQIRRVIIKSIPTELHEMSVTAMAGWFEDVATQLEKATGLGFYQNLAGCK